MKKISTIIIAMALLFGMAQCKKQETPATPNAEGNEVYITMKVGGGDRHIVYPGTGAVVYGNGDVIYVGDGSKYLGTLSFNDGVFGGTITEPAVGDYLYFYFLGGLSITPSATTTSYTVNIANQSQKLPVLSCGRSSAPYSTSNTTYSSMLENKCALVKFGLTTGTSDAVSVAGMRTGATINFNNPESPIVANGSTGSITLKSEGSTEKWAILLPQNAVSNANVTIGSGSGFTVDVPATTANGYITSGIEIDNTPVSGHAIASAVKGDLICDDNQAYAGSFYNRLPSGVNAIALVAYVDDWHDHILALALEDEGWGTMSWSDAMVACYNKDIPISVSGADVYWILGECNHWNNMINAAGDFRNLRDCFESVGGTNMSNEPWNGYWSDDADFGLNTAQYYNFEHGWWGSANMDEGMHVRAVLYIDL